MRSHIWHEPLERRTRFRVCRTDAERPTPLLARSVPQRSRSQGRPSGAASAGLPLDGGESEGKARWRAIGQSWMTEKPGILWKSLKFSVATTVPTVFSRV